MGVEGGKPVPDDEKLGTDEAQPAGKMPEGGPGRSIAVPGRTILGWPPPPSAGTEGPSVAVPEVSAVPSGRRGAASFYVAPGQPAEPVDPAGSKWAPGLAQRTVILAPDRATSEVSGFIRRLAYRGTVLMSRWAKGAPPIDAREARTALVPREFKRHGPGTMARILGAAEGADRDDVVFTRAGIALTVAGILAGSAFIAAAFGRGCDSEGEMRGKSDAGALVDPSSIPDGGDAEGK